MKNNIINKTIFLLMCLTLIVASFASFSDVRASVETSYDFIPVGINYLDPNNLEYVRIDNGYNVKSKELIKINQKTCYYFNIYDNLGYFAGGNITVYTEEGDVALSYSPILSGKQTITEYTGDAGVGYISFSLDIVYNNPADLNQKCNLVLYNEDVNINNVKPSDLIYQGEFGYQPIEKEYNYYTNASDPVTLEKLYEEIKVFDDVDGDISDKKQIINDTYSENFGEVGKWLITYSVTDNGGNTTTLNVYIHVADDIAPEFEGPEYLEVAHNEPITMESVKEQLKASDNALGDITKNIELLSDTYTNNKNNVGIYEMIFSVSDNIQTVTHTVTIEVYYNDIYAPEFIGDFEIEIGNNMNTSIEELLMNIDVRDDVDENLNFNIIYDEYSDNIGKVGTYKVTLTVTDSSHNNTNQDVFITIVDKTPPVFMVYSKKIYLNANVNVATTNDLIKYLQKTNNLDTDTQYEVIYDEYSENKNTPGKYRVIFKDGDTKTGVMVEVVERMYEVQDDISFFVRVKTFFKNIFTNIGNFFGGLFQ